MAVDFAELKVRICEALGHASGVSVDANGYYYCECDKDYRDELSDEEIADVLKGRLRFRVDGKEHFEEMEPSNVLYTLLAEGYQEEMWRIEDEILDDVKKHPDVAGFIEENGVDDDSLRECLGDVWYVKPPVADYLKQAVCMDIMLDTGDRNYEFTCNNLVSSDIESVDDFDENSSLLWLCEQQGVTREELLNAIDKGTAHSDDVVRLRERKAELVSQLKLFGLKEPRFGERVFHTGAYWEFTRLQENIGYKKRDVARLQIQYKENDLSYPEYLKKHFEKYERLDPMPEERFNVRKAEVLENISGRLAKAEGELAALQEKLIAGADFSKIASLQSEYTEVMQQLRELSKTDVYQTAEFIDSVVHEVHNATNVGVVTFLVKMSLEEAVRLQEVVQAEEGMNHSYYYENRTGKSSVVLDKSVRCGLMDDCSGGGSVFEIKLLKDVEIPVKALYRAVPDRANGNYGFQEIYGENDEEFAEALKEIRAVEPEMVEDLIAAAEDKCEKLNNDLTPKSDIDVEKGF